MHPIPIPGAKTSLSSPPSTWGSYWIHEQEEDTKTPFPDDLALLRGPEPSSGKGLNLYDSRNREIQRQSLNESSPHSALEQEHVFKGVTISSLASLFKKSKSLLHSGIAPHQQPCIFALASWVQLLPGIFYQVVWWLSFVWDYIVNAPQLSAETFFPVSA